ncbi:UPF0598 protein CG30010 [Drosophila albomicans]|uniref:UPF0598 protein CG30010 n=1 Tax=Drosophila albomicans TaxID=7291 RepID=A0A6P8X1R3_DROAB|nr:UPF0598 protein CG30010 [Drosophila albomicans]
MSPQSKRLLTVCNWHLKWTNRRNAALYTQGQSPEPRIREYFYYIDHEGMLFLDDAKMKNFTSCFKEKKFLQFFFSRLRQNETQRYEMFPFMSPCGRERNFVRCDDTPIVFTEQHSGDNATDILTYAHGGPVLSVAFQPHNLYMHPKSGRVYHPAWPKVGGIGLVRSKLAIELSQYFIFTESDASPTHFQWRGNQIQLQHDWIKDCQLQPNANTNN